MRCGGDAYLNRSEDIEWVCLQCGRSVPDAQSLISAEVTVEPLIAVEPAPAKVAA
jgi:hypothetical protein